MGNTMPFRWYYPSFFPIPFATPRYCRCAAPQQLINSSVSKESCVQHIVKAMLQLLVQASGGATAWPPRAAGRARRRSSKENFLYIKEEYYNLLAK